MNLQELLTQIKQGKIFIYPTDTIYGIGCDATNKEAVDKIREIKQRDNKPFSIIAPSVKWIKDNCIVDKALNINKYLPGPYTIILKKKNKDFLLHVSNTDTLGIRIPDNDFCRKIQKSGLPFITTSVNLSGEPFAKSISEIGKEIINKVDFVIDVGELSGKPSTLIVEGEQVQRTG